MNPVAFTSPQLPASRLLDALAAAGYEIGQATKVWRTLLDTFDGRLHAAGLRVELQTAGARELVLTDGRSAPGRAAVPDAPRFAADLPPGPLRDRLMPLLDVRALLPVATVTATARSAVRRDGQGKARIAIEVHDRIGVEGRPKPPQGLWAAELQAATGYAKDAVRARALLRSLGLRPAGGDMIDVAVEAAGVDRKGYVASPTIALARDELALDAFRRVLANLAAAVDANWVGTVEDLDPEFLHDLRVAVRRTRSVLAQGKRVLPADVRSTYRDAFSWLGTVTSPARDLDVYVIEWEGYVAALGEEVAAALEPVRRHIVAEREAAHSALAQVLRSARYDEVMGGWRSWLAGPVPADVPGGADAGRRIGKLAAQHIRDAHELVLVRGRGIGPDTPAETLHELRKDAKRLRYLIECFGGLFAAGPRRAFVQRLKALQDNLGEHQDAEVHVAQLREIGTVLADQGALPATLVALGQLSERLDRRRRSARQEFAGRFSAYDTKRTAATLEQLLKSSSTS